LAGNLDGDKNSPGPTHVNGPNRVAGTASGQCAAFTPPATVPNCAALATDSAYGLAGNPLITAVTATLVAATPANAAYCNVQLTYSAISGTEYGYAAGEAQAIRVGIG